MSLEWQKAQIKMENKFKYMIHYKNVTRLTFKGQRYSDWLQKESKYILFARNI